MLNNRRNNLVHRINREKKERKKQRDGPGKTLGTTEEGESGDGEIIIHNVNAIVHSLVDYAAGAVEYW